MPSQAEKSRFARFLLPVIVLATIAAGCSTGREYTSSSVTTNSLPPRPVEGMNRDAARRYGQGYNSLGRAESSGRPGDYRWNGNPNRVQEGAAPAPSLPPPQAVATPGGQRSIVVRPGDTLYSLSRHYGVTVEALAEHNNLATANLRAGQTLHLPPQAR